MPKPTIKAKRVKRFQTTPNQSKPVKKPVKGNITTVIKLKRIRKGNGNNGGGVRGSNRSIRGLDKGIGVVKHSSATNYSSPVSKPLSKRFRGKAKKGEIRNPGGRKKGSRNKLRMYEPPDIKDVRDGLVTVFQNSRARGVISAMLNFKLPPGYAELYSNRVLNRRTMILLQNKKENNFKWAMSIMVKLFPKEMALYGKIEHAHTLTGMVKRATSGEKSKKVLKLVETQTAEGLTEYRLPESEGGEG